MLEGDCNFNFYVLCDVISRSNYLTIYIRNKSVHVADTIIAQSQIVEETVAFFAEIVQSPQNWTKCVNANIG